MWKIDVILWLIAVGTGVAATLFSVSFIVMIISSITWTDLKDVLKRKI